MNRTRIAAAAVLIGSSLGAQQPRTAVFAEPSLSPDGAQLAFVSAGDIWVAPSAGGDAHLVVGHTANDFRPRWSPDGTKLAFVSTRSGNGDIYVLDIAAGALSRLTFDDGAEQLDAWSPDGRYIYFSLNSHDISGMQDVYRVRSTGGTSMPVAADRYASEYWAAPSPDGRRLAITARGTTAGQWWRRGSSHIDEAEIWTVTLGATPSYERVSRGERPGKGRDVWPMWSPDGRTIYYVSDRGGQENLYAQVPGDTARRQLTTFTDGRVLWPQVARDGSRIVFERDFSIWSLDIATGAAAAVPLSLRGAPTVPVAEHQAVTAGIQDFSLSPDGKKVAYVVRGEVFAADAKAGGEGARVTTTVQPEGMPAWAPDSRRLAYSSWREGKARVFVYDFASRTERALTAGGDDINARWSPDGRSVAFVRGGSELRVVEVASGDERLVARGVQLGNVPFVPDGNFAFSPDGRHIAFLSVGERGFLNAHVVPVSGGEPQQVSFLANAFGGTIAWSADQRSVFFDNAQRTEDGQLIRVDLVPRAPRFREARFEALFPQDTATSRDSAAARARNTTPAAVAAAREAREPVRVEREGLRRRATALPVEVSAGGVSVSPDGKTLAFVATAAGQTQVWTWSIDDNAAEAPQARQLTSSPGGKGNVQWSGDSKEIWFTSAGRVQAIGVENRQARTLALSASLDVDFRAEAPEVFRQVWSWTRDNFYDPEFHGVDWDAVRTRYEPVVAATRTPEEMRRVLGLMVGELNASHSGVGGPASQPPSTGRLGVEFERAAYEDDGRLRIRAVIPHGAAALAGGIDRLDYLLAIDGVAISARTNIDSLLANRTGDRVRLRVAGNAEGRGARTVEVMPQSTGAEKNALYRAWVDERRAYVDRVSNGAFGYVHMFDMGAGSLQQLYVDLDAENHGKQGIVIDIRNNNGGFVNAYALDVFSRRPYMTMERRSAVEVPARLQLGQRAFEKPTVLVTNQHSLSDAEDFTEGYRALDMGPVVGEPTSGWIIYTSNFTLFDGTTLRIPFIRIRDAEGNDMELVPRPVDVRVDRPVGESYRGVDSQLDAAVAALRARLR